MPPEPETDPVIAPEPDPDGDPGSTAIPDDDGPGEDPGDVQHEDTEEPAP